MPKQNAKFTPKDYETSIFPTWCPGCGDWSIWGSIKAALAALELDPNEICVVYGIGCSGNMCSFVNAYGFHSLHGRALPNAEGIKLANPDLPVLVVTGDGDNFGEGMGHWIHSMRANHDVTHLVHDNEIYGLTTGQTSPTSPKGTRTKTTPHGSIEEAVNPIALALEGGASWVGRGFAGDHKHLTELVTQAMQHKGFSFLDIFQPCVTFNHVQTYDWYRERLYNLQDDSAYHTDDFEAASHKAHEWGDQVPMGVFYQADKPVYHEQIEHVKHPLVAQPLKPDIKPLLKEFS